jgi:hypothetical protein
MNRSRIILAALLVGAAAVRVAVGQAATAKPEVDADAIAALEKTGA